MKILNKEYIYSPFLIPVVIFTIVFFYSPSAETFATFFVASVVLLFKYLHIRKEDNKAVLSGTLQLSKNLKKETDKRYLCRDLHRIAGLSETDCAFRMDNKKSKTVYFSISESAKNKLSNFILSKQNSEPIKLIESRESIILRSPKFHNIEDYEPNISIAPYTKFDDEAICCFGEKITVERTIGPKDNLEYEIFGDAQKLAKKILGQVVTDKIKEAKIVVLISHGGMFAYTNYKQENRERNGKMYVKNEHLSLSCIAYYLLLTVEQAMDYEMPSKTQKFNDLISDNVEFLVAVEKEVDLIPDFSKNMKNIRNIEKTIDFDYVLRDFEPRGIAWEILSLPGPD